MRAIAPALCLVLVLAGAPLASHAQTSTPVAAARAYIASLITAERKTLMSFDDTDRRAARLTPGRRGGLSLRAMRPATRAATWRVLQSVLSPAGVRMVRAVIDRERRLAVIEQSPEYRHPDKYYLAIFGTPGPGRWGLRFEGHHLSINLTLQGNRIVTVLPFLIGANPRKGPPGDVLLPFIRSARTAGVFRENFRRLLRRGTAVPPVGAVKIDLTNLEGFGHPHLIVR